MAMLRSKLAELEERKRQRGDRRARGARRRTSTSARRSAPTSCTPTRRSRTTARTSRSGDVQRVLDGDLDDFVRAYLLQEAGRRARRRCSCPSRTAPYLEALASYGFRGPTRFHVPGHKGGAGRRPRPAPRDRRGGADCSTSRRTSRGSTSARRRRRTSAPRRSPPTCTAPQRTWFLTNGATQGNHALCLALAPAGDRGRRRSATRTARSSTASCSAAACRASWRPSTTTSSGMAHGVTPDGARGGAGRARPAPRAAFVVSPTYYGMAADVAGLRRGGARRAASRWSSTRRGARTSASTATCRRSALAAGRRRRAHLDAQDRRLADAVGDAARRRRPAASTPSALARTVRLTRSTSPSSLLLASLDAARRQLAIHGEALLGRTLAAAARAREAIDAIEGCRVVGEELVGRPGVAAWDPLRIVIDVRGTGCTGYEVAAGAARGSDVHVELATHATIVLVLGIGQPVGALERFAHDLRRRARRDPPAGRAAAILAQPGDGAEHRDGRAAARGVPAARPRSSTSTRPSAASRPSRSPATRRASRRCCRASGSPPRWSPTCASWRGAGRAPARRQRPGVRHDHRPRGD